MGKWICSDSDCFQHYRKISDTVYSFIEIRSNHTTEKSYAVCHSVVDLQNYTISELREICLSYYPTLEEIVASYGVDEALHVVAECVFEQLPLYEVEIIGKSNSFDDACQLVTVLMEKWSCFRKN